MNWSKYQQDIFAAVASLDSSLIINAVAGSGKTTTILEAINHLPAGAQRVAFLAFNKAIAEELGRRITRVGARAMTLHSAGFAAWKRSLEWDSNLLKVDEGKTWRIIREVAGWKDASRWGETTKRLVSYAKGIGLVPAKRYASNHSTRGLVFDTDAEWERLMDHYGLDADECNLELARAVLTAGLECSRQVIDFDDMLYVPVVEGVAFDQYDVVFVDEAQDVSGIQMEMVARMVVGGGKVVAVGDPSQAVYGFRGAGTNSMELMRERFKMRELPLSVSYRCPRAVVLHAQQWVPRIEHAEDAADGYVGVEGTDWRGQAGIALTEHDKNCDYWLHEDEMATDCTCGFDKEGDAYADTKGVGTATGDDRSSSGLADGTMAVELVGQSANQALVGISKWQPQRDGDPSPWRPTDAILCRMTRLLVAAAFELIRRRVPCRVLGRDIGQGLIKMIRKVIKRRGGDEETGIEAFAEWLGEWMDAERARLTAKRKFDQIGRLEDQAATVGVFIEDAPEGARVGFLIGEIEGMFADAGEKRGVLTLATVHKFKGMEAPRVFVLDAGKYMPCPWASRGGWEYEQEINLCYVAATRAKKELRYITSEDLGIDI